MTSAQATQTSSAVTSAEWRARLAPYATPRWGAALRDLATSVVPYVALWIAMYLLLDVSYWLVLALSIPAAGFLVRTFIVFHDCTHGSFMPSREVNNMVGRVTGVLVFAPFRAWQHDHAMHHATAGDLDRRGAGDVPTYTVAEYRAMPWIQRVGYRLFRNPMVMFTIGPIFAMIVTPRFVSGEKRLRLNNSVMLTNLALVLLVGMFCFLIGWRDFLAVEGPSAVLAGTVGVWLFYVQHQFEDVYWENHGDWTYADAALRGSSYLKLPKVLQYFTGNIGLHHVHHLSARVPNYNLQRAHDENPVFHSVPVLSLWDGLRAVRLKLYDEESGRLVGWRELRADRSLRADAVSP
jgi:acyl-lipid omega-6 desaturase (Delta-12 desaturase)